MFEAIGKLYEDITGITVYKQKLSMEDLVIASQKVALDDVMLKLKQANDLVYQSSKTEQEKAQKILDQQNTITSLEQSQLTIQGKLNDSQNAIDSLKTALALTGEPITAKPLFLDGNKVYEVKRQIIRPGPSISDYIVLDPREMFATFQFHKQLIKDNGWRSLSKHDKLMKAWDYTCRRAGYVADYQDNWQLALDTYYRKEGDCEDKSVLFITMCRALGIPATEVFLCVGNTSFGYHAWAIAYYNAQEASIFNGTEGWYIFETTLGSANPKPGKLAGSAYWIDDGMMNWEHYGQVKPGFRNILNATSVGASAVTKPRIDNSKKKNDMIKKHWAKLAKEG